MLDTLISLATSPEFLAGLRVGLVSTLIAIGLGVWWRRRTGRPAPIAGVLLGVGTLWAIPVTREVPLPIWVGIALLGLAGLLGSLALSSRSRIVVTALGSLPGAYVLGYLVDFPGPPWTRWLLVLGVVVAGPLVADFDEHHHERAWGPPLLVISVLGLLFTVPDTEEALVLTGVALPFALLGGPVRMASLGRAGSLMAVGLFLWVTLFGGLGRQGSMVGAAASLGFLVAEPVTRHLRGSTLLDALDRPWNGAVRVGAFQLALVLVTSRIAGLQQEAVPAAIVAGFALLTSAAVLTLRPSMTTLGVHSGRE